jgi:hypothetical protein
VSSRKIGDFGKDLVQLAHHGRGQALDRGHPEVGGSNSATRNGSSLDQDIGQPHRSGRRSVYTIHHWETFFQLLYENNIFGLKLYKNHRRSIDWSEKTFVANKKSLKQVWQHFNFSENNQKQSKHFGLWVGTIAQIYSE